MARKKRLFRLSEATAAGVHPEYVRRLTGQGQLTRVGRGLYALPRSSRPSTTRWLRWPSASPKQFSACSPRFRFHGLGTQNPREVWSRVGSSSPGYRESTSRLSGLSGSLAPPSRPAIDVHDIEGVKVRVTTPARTVVDCFKFRNKDRHRRGGRGPAGLPPHAEGHRR
jgi:predicted transcriptional regulator of viral defense system